MHIVSSVLSQIASAISADITAAIAKKLGTSAAGTTIGGAIWNWIKKGVTSTGSSNATDVATSVSTSLLSKIKTTFSNMSTAFKATISVAGFATEFLTISRAMEQVVISGEATAATFIEIAAGIGTVTAALALMDLLNPLTAALEVIVAIAAGIYGIKQAADEAAFNDWFNNMKTIGTVTIDDLTASAISSFDEITANYSSMKESLDTISETKTTISETIDNFDLLSKAISLGAYTASEKVDEIISTFETLFEKTSNIFSGMYDVIIEGLCGSLGEATDEVGYSSTEILGDIAVLNEKGNEHIASLKSQIYELIDQYKAGEISADDFLAAATPLVQELRSINTDESTTAINELNEALNLAAETAANGLDVETVKAQLAQMTDAYNKTLETVKNADEGWAQTAQDYIEYARKMGIEIPESLDNIDWSMISDKDIEDITAEIQGLYEAACSKIEDALIYQIPDVINNSTANWEEMNPLRKLFTYGNDINNYYSEQLGLWQENTVGPVEGAIQDALDEIGSDAKTYAGDTAQEIIDSLFEPMQSEHSGTILALKSNWESTFSQSTETLPSKAKEAGENTAAGFAEGVSSDSSMSTATGAMSKLGERSLDAFTDTMKIHSPSQVMK
jgi:hypothetical protein